MISLTRITRSSIQPLKRCVSKFNNAGSGAMFSSTTPMTPGTVIEATKSTTETTIEQTANGQIETITQFVSHYGQEPAVISTFAIYSIGVLGKYGLESYLLGKRSLLNFRSETPDKDITPLMEYNAVIYGCRQASFLGAIAWPYTMAGEIMPGIVYALNSRKTPTSSSSSNPDQSDQSTQSTRST